MGSKPRGTAIRFPPRKTAAVPCLCLLLLGCPGEQPERPVVLVPAEWQDGEVSVYDIARNDSVFYRSSVQVRFDEELFRPADGTPGSLTVPTIELTSSVRTVLAEEYFSDSSVVVLRRDNLTPLRSFRVLATQIGEFEVQTRYEPGRASITKQSIDGTQVQELRLPPNAYDNEMVPFVLRSLPLVPATKLSIKAVVPLDMRLVAVELTVLGTKLVSSRLGDIICREVQMTLPNRQVRLWYELAQPHRLVRLYDRARETELRLVEYRPSRADSL